MKKTALFAVMAAIAMVSCRKPKDSFSVIPVESATKKINIFIAQGKSYADQRYNGLEANLRISIAKVSKEDGASIALWDTTIANQSIRLYPVPHQPFTFSKTFTAIKDSKESLSVSYWIGYKDRNNQVSGEGKNDFAPYGNSNLNFHVRL
jgi:hypothetical protein